MEVEVICKERETKDAWFTYYAGFKINNSSYTTFDLMYYDYLNRLSISSWEFFETKVSQETNKELKHFFINAGFDEATPEEDGYMGFRHDSIQLSYKDFKELVTLIKEIICNIEG